MTLAHSQTPYSELRLGILAEGPSLHVLRRTTEAALRSWGQPELVDDALVVVNELGTNAAEAAPGEWMELGLRLLPEGVMVELWDSSPDLPPEAGPDELNLLDLDAEGGR